MAQANADLVAIDRMRLGNDPKPTAGGNESWFQGIRDSTANAFHWLKEKTGEVASKLSDVPVTLRPVVVLAVIIGLLVMKKKGGVHV
ncbi:MAG: hypothetical protein HYW51_00150 [Candidatus Doudnabacteria bacterium]|nr:hypothetical protein [Candidatus Doudnabacteria bacterium]